MADSIAEPGATAEHTVAETELKPGAIGLPGVLMIGVTAIAPAIAGMFTIPFIVSNAGVTAPLAYLGAFVIALMLGYVLAQFSKYMTSAGTYYTFVSRSLGGRIGFLVAWTYLLFYPVVVAQVGSFMGDTLEKTLKAEYGWTFKWWWFMVLLIILVAVTAYRGIEISTEIVIVLGIIETLIVLALAISGFIDPGAGGINLQWLNPGNAPSGHALFLGVVFAIFAISGWDAAAPTAEESEDPKRNVPRGVIGCILILGLFLFIVSWGQITGWGTDKLDSFSSSSELPAFVLGHKYWGGAWVIVLIALLNSAVAVAIATTNAATRFIYGMARTGVLPRQLTVVHPKYKTPTTAIAFQTVVNVCLGLILPIAVGVANVYNITGTWFTFALAPVYAAANVGLFYYVRKHHPGEFHWFKHVLVPLVGIIALACVVYYSLNPLPAWPIKLAPLVVVLWLALGVVMLFAMIASGRESMLARAGDAVAERIETPEEHAARPEYI
ncbi:MAG: APC family permease [Gaiellaceae bacterium]